MNSIHQRDESLVKERKILSIARSAVGQKQLLLSMVVTKYLKVHLNIAENHNDTVRMFRNSKQSLVLEVRKVRKSRKKIVVSSILPKNKQKITEYFLKR